MQHTQYTYTFGYFFFTNRERVGWCNAGTQDTTKPLLQRAVVFFILFPPFPMQMRQTLEYEQELLHAREELNKIDEDILWTLAERKRRVSSVLVLVPHESDLKMLEHIRTMITNARLPWKEGLDQLILERLTIGRQIGSIKEELQTPTTNPVQWEHVLSFVKSIGSVLDLDGPHLELLYNEIHQASILIQDEHRETLRKQKEKKAV
jgi:chorismate mutase